ENSHYRVAQDVIEASAKVEEIDHVPVIPKRPNETSQASAAASAPMGFECIGDGVERGLQLVSGDCVAPVFDCCHVPRELVQRLLFLHRGRFGNLHKKLCARKVKDFGPVPERSFEK